MAEILIKHWCLYNNNSYSTERKPYDVCLTHLTCPPLCAHVEANKLRNVNQQETYYKHALELSRVKNK